MHPDASQDSVHANSPGEPTGVAEQLRTLCRALRVDILTMIHGAGSGHPGGSLSAVDIIATLYGYHLRHDPDRPTWTDRDRFVLSKGHAAPALYAVLAHHGYIARSELRALRELGSRLEGHPVVGTVPGVEACTGSLGQGLSIAVGVALAARLDGRETVSYCMTGDGELQEGQVWEAAMSASAYKLDNLVAIVDLNGGQLDGHTHEILPLGPLQDKWVSFGWDAYALRDGHDYVGILEALRWARTRAQRPKVIIAKTVKGKGVPFMEDDTSWHGKAPTDRELADAVRGLHGGAGAVP